MFRASAGIRSCVATTRKVNALKQLHPDLVVLAAHDPAAAGMLEGALMKAAT